jgi:hypothetical protein
LKIATGNTNKNLVKAAAIIIVKAKVLDGLLLRGPVVRPRLGVYQLVLVLVFLRGRERRNED